MNEADKKRALDELRHSIAERLEGIRAECERRNVPMGHLTLIARLEGNDDMSVIVTNDSRIGISRILDRIWPI